MEEGDSSNTYRRKQLPHVHYDLETLQKLCDLLEELANDIEVPIKISNSSKQLKLNSVDELEDRPDLPSTISRFELYATSGEFTARINNFGGHTVSGRGSEMFVDHLISRVEQFSKQNANRICSLKNYAAPFQALLTGAFISFYHEQLTAIFISFYYVDLPLTTHLVAGLMFSSVFLIEAAIRWYPNTVILLEDDALQIKRAAVFISTLISVLGGLASLYQVLT